MSGATPRPEQLISSCQGLVRSIAWKIHRRLPTHIDLDDLIGDGQVGLAEAARDYDPSRGAQFTTFAYYRIRGAILDGLSRTNWFNQADYSRGRYERMADAVLDADQNDSSSALSEDIQWFRSVTRSLGVVFLFSQAQADEEHPMDVEARPEPTAVDKIVREETVERLWVEVDRLPEDERTLMLAAYREGLSLKAAGERIGISKAWASRLHGRILEKLARAIAPD